MKMRNIAPKTSGSNQYCLYETLLPERLKIDIFAYKRKPDGYEQNGARGKRYRERNRTNHIAAVYTECGDVIREAAM